MAKGTGLDMVMKAYTSQSGRQSYSYIDALLSLLIIIEGWQTGLWGTTEEEEEDGGARVFGGKGGFLHIFSLCFCDLFTGKF